MGILSKRQTKESRKRVVVTGKRLGGVWTMESSITPRQRRAKRDSTIVATDNRRIRTLH